MLNGLAHLRRTRQACFGEAHTVDFHAVAFGCGGHQIRAPTWFRRTQFRAMFANSCWPISGLLTKPFATTGGVVAVNDDPACAGTSGRPRITVHPGKGSCVAPGDGRTGMGVAVLTRLSRW